jgi:hypothetical protein
LCTAVSRAEAEHVVASLTAKEIVWLHQLLLDIGFPQDKPTLLMCNNQNALNLLFNPEFHQGTKHIDICYHVICDFEECHEIFMFDIISAEQCTDILNKALMPRTFSASSFHAELVAIAK